MPAQKKTIKTINIRLDAKTIEALDALIEIHSELSISDIIRLAIIEKAKHDKKKSGTRQNTA
jgi:hypothetical protein